MRSLKSNSRKGMVLRLSALKLAIIMLFNLGYSTLSFALTSGPSQPEVQGFTPIGTTEMVNAFTGDYNYNIPLLDVDGYPINISYQSGPGMEQEASWVGLGWSLNVGTIQRNLRGLPDDFKGELVTRVQNSKPSRTIGIGHGGTGEIFGWGGLNLSVDVDFNNYYGFGFSKSASLGISSGKGAKLPMNASLGITSDSNDGISIQPNISLTAKLVNSEKAFTNLGLSIGTSFNTRAGIKNFSFSTSISAGNNQFLAPKRLSAGISNNSSFDVGQQTYTPTAGPNMTNYSITGRLTVGSALFGLHPGSFINAYYTVQSLKDKYEYNPAYGYMYSGKANTDKALMDFNREKDGAFVNTIPVLPITNFTYDIFSVSGQGIGGSYRAFRGDVGSVFDASSRSDGGGGNIDGELGSGGLFHIGASITLNHHKSESGKWTNDATSEFKFSNKYMNDLHEDFYFKEANEGGIESDPAWRSSFGGYSPVKFDLNVKGKFDIDLHPTLEKADNSKYPVSDTKRTKRDMRSNVFMTLTHEEVEMGLGLFKNDYTDLGIHNLAQPHHISEISVISEDGSRYFYSIPVYNTYQKEVTFALNQPGEGDYSCTDFTVAYIDQDASTDNDNGIDNYYSANITPAYAHSYLLTAIVSPDYVDSDHIAGPSEDDLGTYTLFKYEEASDYKWRNPLGENQANYYEGIEGDQTDNKASYIYGEKEIRYLKEISTKNYVCAFVLNQTEDDPQECAGRCDARGVIDESGNSEPGQSNSRYLTRIDLYTKDGYEQELDPLKSVHFQYEYELCANVPGSPNGKLTLKEMYFTYGNSMKGKLSPYKFDYTTNVEYSNAALDRWGGYKPTNCYPLNNAEFPYSDQSYTGNGDNRVYDIDSYADAWHLSKIGLPSGGEIVVDYESDDYAYVQNKKAMQMYKLVGVYNSDNQEANFSNVIDLNEGVEGLLFELPTQNLSDFDIANLAPEAGNKVYLKCKVDIAPDDLTSDDQIPVYAELQDSPQIVSYGGEYYGYVKLIPVPIDGNNGSDVNPITLAAIQFGRLNAPKILYGDASPPAMSDAGELTVNFVEQLLNFIFDANLMELFSGPNQNRWDAMCGRNFRPKESFIRLGTPHGHKKGGGSRVKSIIIHDNWDSLSASHATNSTYGQKYEYLLEDGRSSGVAAYEPLLGGDENPFRMPLEYSINNVLAPDIDRFIELPVGESFYPAPSVGYSRVVISDLVPEDAEVERHGTGKVIQEFYTAKDFPTTTERTDLEIKRHKTPALTVASLLKINARDHVTTTQGFSVTTNDMHGKQKSQAIYAQGQDMPISSVRYEYQTNENPAVLNNLVKVIRADGSISSAEMGVHFDMVADMRESFSRSMSAGGNANVETFILPIPSIPPIIGVATSVWPHYSKDVTLYRSATTTKVIQRFGVLSKTIATDNTSVVETRTLAYDALTGAPLITETINNFDDHSYSLTFPAHWYYSSMGPASKNIGFVSNELTFDANGYAEMANARIYFHEGDEVACEISGVAQRAWVVSVDSYGLTAVLKNGNPVTGAQHFKILRSGRRNMSTLPMAQITMMANPLDYFSGNLYEHVVQASAVEFTDEWGMMCDCNSKDGQNYDSTNPYVSGAKGVWRPSKNYTFLTGRSLSYYNNNTNIREDGEFLGFSPFYYHSNGVWNINQLNWTWAAEVTQFSPFGQEVESRDALGRYSAAHFGYKQTLPIAVASNAKYSQIGFNNFEDGDYCSQSLGFVGGSIDQTRAHTGRQSLKVTSGNSAIFQFDKWDDCVNTAIAALSLTPNPLPQYHISISGGNGKYSVSLEVVNGSAEVTDIIGDDIYITSTPGSYILVKAKDSDGMQGEIYTTTQ